MRGDEKRATVRSACRLVLAAAGSGRSGGGSGEGVPWTRAPRWWGDEPAGGRGEARPKRTNAAVAAVPRAPPPETRPFFATAAPARVNTTAGFTPAVYARAPANSLVYRRPISPTGPLPAFLFRRRPDAVPPSRPRPTFLVYWSPHARPQGSGIRRCLRGFAGKQFGSVRRVENVYRVITDRPRFICYERN